MEAVQKEAESRESGKVLDMENYHYVRRGSSAALACFALFEPVLGIQPPRQGGGSSGLQGDFDYRHGPLLLVQRELHYSDDLRRADYSPRTCTASTWSDPEESTASI